MAPSFDICGDLLELLLTAPQLSNRLPPLPENSPTPESSHQSYNRIIWERYLIENKEMWREEAQKRGTPLVINQPCMAFERAVRNKESYKVDFIDSKHAPPRHHAECLDSYLTPI